MSQTHTVKVKDVAYLIEEAGAAAEKSSPELIRNYAEALLNVASEENQVDEVLNDLDHLGQELLRAEPDLVAILIDPVVRIQDKDRLLDKILSGRVHATALKFLRVLNSHGRLILNQTIVQKARELWDQRQNRRHVTVRSAVALDAGQLAAVTERLKGLLGGATPVLKTEVDPSLVGGLVIQVGDRRYDASIRTQLQSLKGRLFATRDREITTRQGALAE